MIDFKKKMEELEKENFNSNQSEELEITKNKRSKKTTNYIIALVVIGLVFSGKIIMSSQSTTDWLAENNFFNKIKHLVPMSDKVLIGEKEDRINILLLGVGGTGHDGAQLSDTLILASLKPSTKQVSLISIPRDMTVPFDDGWRKINSINALAEAKIPSSGGPASAEALSNILQMPIDYYIRVDFAGFIKIINEIGGVEVYVENSFDDYTYPILGQEDNPDYYARFEHLSIKEGWQKMDGSLALKYARSRHAYGIEGSDFARARRQQLLLEATKNKLLSRQTLLNPVTVGKLLSSLNQNISTDLDIWEMIKIWDLFKDINKDQIINKVLSDAPDGLLVSSISPEGAYILTPTSGNFSQIRLMVQNIFDQENPTTSNNNQTPVIKKISSQASVSVKNGTWITGLANKNSLILENQGFTVAEIGNAPNRENEKTVVFDLTYGNKNEALNAIKDSIGAEQSFDFPEWLNQYEGQPENPDFILFLGTDNNSY